MKRKDLDFDHAGRDGVFDFTLASPACKIRRLDAMPPIMEQEETDIPLRFDSPELRACDGQESQLRGPVIEELPPDAENSERAMVLFNPRDTPLCHSPSQFVVDSDLISCIKNRSAHWINSNSNRFVEYEGSKAAGQLAVVPWVPSQRAVPPDFSETEFSEPMDAEETGAPMEAEGNIATSGVLSTNEENQQLLWSNGTVVPQQWQQQHCMIPQLPQSMNTPIVWYR